MLAGALAIGALIGAVWYFRKDKSKPITKPFVVNTEETLGTIFPPSDSHNSDVADTLGTQYMLYLLYLPIFNPEWNDLTTEEARQTVKATYMRYFRVHPAADAQDPPAPETEEEDWDYCYNAYYSSDRAPYIFDSPDPENPDDFCSIAEDFYRLSRTAANPEQALKFRGTVVGPVQLPYEYYSNVSWAPVFTSSTIYQPGAWYSGIIRTLSLLMDFINRESLFHQERWHSRKDSSFDPAACLSPGTACTYLWDKPVCVVSADNYHTGDNGQGGECRPLREWFLPDTEPPHEWIVDPSRAATINGREIAFRRTQFGNYLKQPPATVPIGYGMACGTLDGTAFYPVMSPDARVYGAASAETGAGAGLIHEVLHELGGDMAPSAIQDLPGRSFTESDIREHAPYITLLTDEIESFNKGRGSYYIDYTHGMGGYTAEEYVTAFKEIDPGFDPGNHSDGFLDGYFPCTQGGTECNYEDAAGHGTFYGYYDGLIDGIYLPAPDRDGICKETHVGEDGIIKGYCVPNCHEPEEPDAVNPPCPPSLTCQNAQLGVVESDAAIRGCTTWNEPTFSVYEFPVANHLKDFHDYSEDDVVDFLIYGINGQPGLLAQPPSPLDECFPPCNVVSLDPNDDMCQDMYGRTGWKCSTELFARPRCVPEGDWQNNMDNWVRWCRLSFEKGKWPENGLQGVISWVKAYEDYDISDPFHGFEDSNFQWTYYDNSLMGTYFNGYHNVSRRVVDLWDGNLTRATPITVAQDSDTRDFENTWYGIAYTSVYFGRGSPVAQTVFSAAYIDFAGEISPFERDWLGWYSEPDIVDIPMDPRVGFCTDPSVITREIDVSVYGRLTPWHSEEPGGYHILRIPLEQGENGKDSVYIDIVDEPRWGESDWIKSGWDEWGILPNLSTDRDRLFVPDPEQTHGAKALFIDERAPYGGGTVRTIDLGDDEEGFKCTSPGFETGYSSDGQIVCEQGLSLGCPMFPRVGTYTTSGFFSPDPCLGLQQYGGVKKNGGCDSEGYCNNFPDAKVLCSSPGNGESDPACSMTLWNVPQKYIPSLGTYFDEMGDLIYQSGPWPEARLAYPAPWNPLPNPYGPFECGRPSDCSPVQSEHHWACDCNRDELYANSYIYETNDSYYPRRRSREVVRPFKVPPHNIIPVGWTPAELAAEDRYYLVRYPYRNASKCFGFKMNVSCDEAPSCFLKSITVRYQAQ